MFKALFRRETYVYLLPAIVLACSAPERTAPEQTGQAEFALTTSIDGQQYDLQNAKFEITGADSVSLTTDDSADGLSLTQQLPVGDYQVELQPGWQLVQISQDPVPLSATLISENPLSFSVQSGETTPVEFRFSVLDEPAVAATGSVALGIGVVREQPRSVIFSELMSNPATLADSAGEWFELSNVGVEAVDLSGCSIARDTTHFSVDGSLVLEPGSVIALANGASPGFTPAYVYSGLTLPNSAVFTLQLTCQGVVLDSITVDPSSWPGANGVAASLSPVVRSPDANDDPAVWCDANASYSMDKGTPGEENPSCP
jgi:hypothetical protein